MAIKQSAHCPSCGKLIQEDFNNCPYCGESIRNYCHKCGKLLEDEFNICPYCGEKVKTKPTSKNKDTHANEHMHAGALVLTTIGKFLLQIGQALKSFSIISFNSIKTNSQKALHWVKSLDWEKFKQHLKNISSSLVNCLKSIKLEKVRHLFEILSDRIANVFNTALPLISKFLKNTWSFLIKIFFNLWDALSHILENKLPPHQARKFAVAIIISVSSLCIIIALLFAFHSSGPLQANQQDAIEQNDTTFSMVDPSEQKWLVMIYANADDEVLENDIYFDINEAEAVGSTNRVQIVAQVDRFTGGYTGDGDWTGARRYFVNHDEDLKSINSELAVDLGEVDMGSTETLIDFVTWAIESYPADRYALILSDHGSGWIGGWYDNNPVNPEGNYIPLNQLDLALNEIIEKTGIGKFDLVGMDACLMSMLEVYNALEPYAHYAVASEEVEPSMGWAYKSFLTELTEHPEIDGSALSDFIVNSYIQHDLRIQDEDAYRELLDSYELPLDVDKELFAQKMAERVTLSAIDLSILPEFNNELNQLLVALKESDQGKVAEARSYAQAFHNIFDDSLPSPYIDLQSFLNIVAHNTEARNIKDLIANLETTMSKMVVANVKGSNYPGASGISIYFPVSQQYWGSDNNSHEWYVNITQRFSENSLWDDFLSFHYANLDFGQGIPSIETRTTAPGYSEIRISTPVISPSAVSSTNPKINIQADVSGDHIAYIYLVSMYEFEGRFLFYESDFIHSDKNFNVNGVIYPDYKRENGIKHINLNYEIEATGVSDGNTVAFAVVEPETYGTDPKDTIYSVKGFYIDPQTGKKTSARMYFYNYGDNKMRNIIGYFGDNEHGSVAPAEIIPEKGDQFQFLDTWWELDENGNVSDQLTEGNVLTFGDQPFMMGVTQNFIYPGTYAIGIGAVDMDGNQTFSFSPVILE